MRDDRHNAGHALDACAVDPDDGAETDRRADDHRMQLPGLVEVGRIARSAGDLGAPVDAGQRLSDDAGRHAISPAISSARTIVRGSSWTL